MEINKEELEFLKNHYPMSMGQDAKPETLTKLQLTLTIEYWANGVSQKHLADLLRRIADLAADEGLMTGETEAEVNGWWTRIIDPETGEQF